MDGVDGRDLKRLEVTDREERIQDRDCSRSVTEVGKTLTELSRHLRERGIVICSPKYVSVTPQKTINSIFFFVQEVNKEVDYVYTTYAHTHTHAQ